MPCEISKSQGTEELAIRIAVLHACQFAMSISGKQEGAKGKRAI